MAATATLSTLGPLLVCYHLDSRRKLFADKYKGREPYAGGAIYCATKAAVRSFTESLRKELIASRVRVIEVDPGQVETVSY